jgi:hypothetical protein
VNSSPALRWRLETIEGCQLAIGAYPLFRYDARGGGGTAVAATGKAPPTDDNRAIRLAFAPDQLRIPALNGRTTRVLGLPLPPGLSITVVPMRLEGEVDPDGGSVSLAFEAAFRFRLRLGSVTLLAPPDLQIRTCLRSGNPLSPTGATTLLGVATVPPCGAPWLDRFLGLPNQALAVLQCRLSPEPDGIP